VAFRALHGANLTPHELSIVNALDADIEFVILERNRLMHDAWLLVLSGDSEVPRLEKYWVRRDGNSYRSDTQEYPVIKLDALIDDVIRLRQAVSRLLIDRLGGVYLPLAKRLELRHGKAFVVSSFVLDEPGELAT
jgi:hypothetical protein